MSRELDARVHSEVLGLEPDRVAIATSDGGKSACASVDPWNGPWRSEHELREWLDERKATGTHLEYEIGAWERCPHYSTDIADAWMVVEKAKAMGWPVLVGVTFDLKGNPTGYFAEFTGEYRAEDENPGTAICEAALPFFARLAALNAIGETP